MKAKQFYRILLFFLVLTAAGSGAGLYWSDKKLKSSSTEVSLLLAERDAQTDKIDKLKTSKNSVQNPDQLNALINSLLPKQKKQDTLIADIIYTTTRQAGISSSQLTSISFSGTGQPDQLSGTTLSKEIQGVYVYPFSISIKDISYDTMQRLFTELEKNKRIIQADQVQITPDKSKPGAISALSLSLKTFVQP